ncbi:TonB family protein [Brevundimonas sp. FT23028]|uniref:TonB family protein n=1 Tax=Brevundimonas sp. FT23028 TaxID=3393748 RepID=UPI003B58B391
MASIPLEPRPFGKGRQSRAPAGRRTGAAILAAAAHAGLLVLVGLQVAPVQDGGAAPVINLTLEPSPRFESRTPPAAEAVADRSAAPAATAPPVPASPPAREVAARPPVDPVIPAALRPAATAPGFEDVRRTGEARDPRQDGDDAGQGRSSVEASVAGATQGGGGRVQGAAAAAQADPYFARVVSWIEQHKRHPGDVAGSVTVRFRLDRGGRVAGLRLLRSSGVRALDRAALEQIRSTQPFPRPDPGVRWATREFTVNIEYRSRPDS